MSVFTRTGEFESFPGSGKAVLDFPEKIVADPNYGRLPWFRDFFSEAWHKMWHEGTFGDLRKEFTEKRPTKPAQPKAGGFPAYVGSTTSDLVIATAYRMLLEDTERKGNTVIEADLEDVRSEGYRGFGYVTDGLHYGRVIKLGRQLPIRKKYDVLAHEDAAIDETEKGRPHKHYKNRDGSWADDEIFRSGTEVGEKYIARAEKYTKRAIAALYNQN